jgi:hypothetical protein
MCAQPNADFVRLYRESGGGDRPAQGGMKVCWGPDEAKARATMHRLWPTDAIPGEAMLASRAFTEAGFDEVYIGQVGGAPDEFFEFYAEQVLPRPRGL